MTAGVLSGRPAPDAFFYIELQAAGTCSYIAGSDPQTFCTASLDVDTTVTNYSVGSAVMQKVYSNISIDCASAGLNAGITAKLKYTTEFLSAESAANAYTYTVNESVNSGDPAACTTRPYSGSKSYNELIEKISYAEANPGTMPDGITPRDGSSIRPYKTTLTGQPF